MSGPLTLRVGVFEGTAASPPHAPLGLAPSHLSGLLLVLALDAMRRGRVGDGVCP